MAPAAQALSSKEAWSTGMDDFAQTDPSNDSLGRIKFCRKLTNILAKGRSRGSVVVALYGDWGSGKSTVKNFTSYFLKEEHGIDVIDFEPWQWSGRNEILRAFFHKVGETLGRSDEKQIARKWERLAARLGIFTPFLNTAKSWWVLILFLFSTSSVVVSVLEPQSRTLQVAIAVAAATIALGILLCEQLAQSLAKYFERLSVWRDESPEVIRAQLAGLLEARPKPLVIVIDDVDRLEPDEIRQVIQLVKSVANLPHTVFLLLFQREVVERALEPIAGPGLGRAFLEKIVQVGLHIPQPPVGKVFGLLESGIRELRQVPAFAKRWDETRWEKEVRPSLEPYFFNLRHVFRFVGAVRGYFDQHIHGGVLEVNPVDLVGLEVLRMFEPTVFEQLAVVPLKTRSLVTQLLVDDADVLNQQNIDLDLLTKLVAEDSRPRAKVLIKALIPQLRPNRNIIDDENSMWDRDLRICHVHHHRKYFDLHLASDRASDRDFSAVVAAAIDRASLRAQFELLNRRSLLKDVIARLVFHIGELDDSKLENIIREVVLLTDSVPEFLGSYSHSNAETLIEEALRKLNSATRIKCFGSLLSGENGLDILVGLVSRFDYEYQNPGSRMGNALFSGEQIPTLKVQALARIRLAAATNSLWSSSSLPMHLLRWKQWGDPVEVRSRIADHLSDGDRALKFLQKWVGVSTVSSRGESWQEPILDGESLNGLCPLEKIEGLLGAHSIESADPKDVPALRLFSAAVSAKKNGQKYSHLRIEKGYGN
jgi:hypothetical protein